LGSRSVFAGSTSSACEIWSRRVVRAHVPLRLALTVSGAEFARTALLALPQTLKCTIDDALDVLQRFHRVVRSTRVQQLVADTARLSAEGKSEITQVGKAIGARVFRLGARR
jgi:hypothetical protein